MIWGVSPVTSISHFGASQTENRSYYRSRENKARISRTNREKGWSGVWLGEVMRHYLIPCCVPRSPTFFTVRVRRFFFTATLFPQHPVSAFHLTTKMAPQYVGLETDQMYKQPTKINSSSLFLYSRFLERTSLHLPLFPSSQRVKGLTSLQGNPGMGGGVN